tara:strand:- start:609 stop:710 length:102 start_codon:yes stop_codon:yes gene_type:complete
MDSPRIQIPDENKIKPSSASEYLLRIDFIKLSD